ncbi:MAG: hypothetical protein ACI8V2_005121, partial [Candidatus Latescibacterota bacterium]
AHVLNVSRFSVLVFNQQTHPILNTHHHSYNATLRFPPLICFFPFCFFHPP